MEEKKITYPESEKAKLPPLKAINRGIQLFVVFTVVGVVLSVWWKSSANLSVVLKHIDTAYLYLLIPLVALDYIIGGFRYRLFFDGKVLPKISMWDNMRANWANIFMGAVTPFQTGGGPAQFYILWRCGAKVSESVLVSAINFAATLNFFLVSSVVALIVLPASIFATNIVYVIKIAFGVVGFIALMVILVLSFPHSGAALIKSLFKVVPARFERASALRDRLVKTLSEGAENFGDSFKQILKRKKLSLVIVVFATLVLFFNKYLIGYVIALALGQNPDFGDFIGLQILHFFIVYFAPTPGASGIAEVSSVWLMEKVMSTDILIIYAVAWRFFTTHLGALIGGFVVLMDTRTLVKKTVQPAKKA